MSDNSYNGSCEQHERRISVLETKVDYLNAHSAAQVEKLDDIDSKVDSIKEHLARQNGALPHMAQSINELKGKMDGFSETKWQAKTMWAIIGVVSTVVVGVVIKLLVGV